MRVEETKFNRFCYKAICVRCGMPQQRAKIIGEVKNTDSLRPEIVKEERCAICYAPLEFEHLFFR